VMRLRRAALLVQRVFRDPSHCGFSPAEQAESFEALVGWVEHGVSRRGRTSSSNDLRTLGGPFELDPASRNAGGRRGFGCCRSGRRPRQSHA